VNTESLRYIVAVAHSGNISEAAKACGVTQPAVSLAVKKAEKDFDIKLFEKRGGRYAVTEQGALLVDYARRIIALESKLNVELAECRDATSGRISLATSNIPGEYILPSLMREFKSRFPSLEPQTQVMDSHQVLEEVRGHRAEIGLLGCQTTGGDIASYPFCTDTLVVIAPPGHPLSKNRSVAAGRLASENFVLREEGSGTRQLMLSALGNAGIEPAKISVAAELGSTSAVISAVEAGAGVSKASIWAIPGHLQEKRMSIVKVRGMKAERLLYLVHPKDRRLSPAAETFREFTLEKRSDLDRKAAALVKAV
jgi:DNA-binding transcriptional LysR family regulator